MKTKISFVMLLILASFAALVHAESTEEAFDRLLAGTWETSTGSILKYEEGQGVVFHLSEKGRKVGYYLGEVTVKDFSYQGDGKFNCSAKVRPKVRSKDKNREYWVNSEIIAVSDSIRVSYPDPDPSDPARRIESGRHSLIERSAPSKPELYISASSNLDTLDTNSKGLLKVSVHNRGKGRAPDVNLNIRTDKDQLAILFDKERQIGTISRGQSQEVSIPVTVIRDLEDGSVTFNIEAVDSKGNMAKTELSVISKSTFQRGLPPNLFAELSFSDKNGNGILEALETAKIQIILTNKGKGTAQGLTISIEDDKKDPELDLGSKVLESLGPGESRTVSIPMRAGLDIKDAGHKLKINVSEHYGFDMDPAYLVLNTAAYQPPKLVFSGLEIIDSGDGTASIVEDGQLQAGESVRAKMVVQNIGQGDAENAQFSIATTNQNIYLENNVGGLGTLKPGGVKEFWLTVTPNKRVATQGNLPIFLTLKEEIGRGSLDNYQLPIQLNIKPPKTEIMTVNPNVAAMKKQFARFEFKSNKFNATVDNLINVKTVKAAKTKRPRSVGVVIGVENYKELPPAPYAANDATLMKEYFEKRLGVEQVVLYRNDEVTGFRFDDIFNPDSGDLQKAIVKGETELFVFYSGHGIPSKSGDEMYLFPADGKVSRLAERGFSINRFYDYLNKLGAKTVTVILDACFSGGSRSSEKNKMENLVAMKGIKLKNEKPWAWNKSFTVINSSSGEETSLGYDASETGLFTYFVAAGLQGRADADGNHKITLGELKKYVMENVMATSKKISGLQTPEFYGDNNRVLVEY